MVIRDRVAIEIWQDIAVTCDTDRQRLVILTGKD